MYSQPKQSLAQEVRDSASWILGFVGVLWGVELVNLAFRHQLLRLGILPRTVEGLPGIVLAPFLHGGFPHLIANTIPLLVLGSLVLLSGRWAFVRATLTIALLGGALTWLLGRPAYHVGASGLIFGYLGYLVAKAWFERRAVPILIALTATALYGGVLWGVLPIMPGVSWEGHLFGFAAGIFAGRDGAEASRVRPALEDL
jgi:membrane associated rhomboid family serine protease